MLRAAAGAVGFVGLVGWVFCDEAHLHPPAVLLVFCGWLCGWLVLPERWR